MKVILNGSNVEIWVYQYVQTLNWQSAEYVYRALTHYLKTGNSCSCGPANVTAIPNQDIQLRLEDGSVCILINEPRSKDLWAQLGFVLGVSYDAKLDDTEIVRLWLTNLVLFFIYTGWVLCLLLPPYPTVRLWQARLVDSIRKHTDWQEHSLISNRVANSK